MPLKLPIVSTPSRMRIVPIEPGKPPEARISDEFCAKQADMFCQSRLL